MSLLPSDQAFPSLPEVDYPAAHSMDMLWFAIDQDGNVAVFSTGENGHAPIHAREADVVYEMEQQRLGQPTDELIEEFGPRLGMFVYDYEEGFDPISPYRRAGSPATPIHVDQLPPAVRSQCKSIQFTGVRFKDADMVQPLESMACAYWYDDRVAFVKSDGLTVLPIPGRESQYREQFQEMVQNGPGLEFTSPPDVPPRTTDD